MAKRSIDFDRPRLFSPSMTRRLLDDGGSVVNRTANDIAESNLTSTASFRYDSNGTGIKSTQQIPVDFSVFNTHTFFSSAEVNVNVAFDRIINEYPFDGTRREVEAFVDSLSGFEKWVFDNFPRNVGYLNFSGSAGASSTEGTYIVVEDFAGYLYPSISKKRTGENVIDPGLKSFTIELQLHVPSITNGNQIVCQKVSGSVQGITLALSQSASTSACNIVFMAASGSQSLVVSSSLAKGQFNHIVATLDRHPGINNIQLYVNETLVATSSRASEFGQFGFPTSPFIIGSGSSHSSFTPTQTLSGSIDELRVFHKTVGLKEQSTNARKSITPSDDLKLYLKFNEPTGSIGTDSIVIDSSGNSLHSLVSNIQASNRSTGSIASPMTSEKRSLHPVLFPAYSEVSDFNAELLASASSYDATNPNLITKLVPTHYFQEGQTFDGFEHEAGTIVDAISGSGPPGSAELGSAQLLSALLYTWARFFDEIKMMIDLFGSIIHVDYDKTGFTADQFLQFLSRYYGFEMPAFFIDASVEQFIDAENISDTISTNTTSLQYVQNQLWRRILTNVGEVIRSKGTLHSIRVLLRSMGIEPDKSFRLREFGGPSFRSLEDSRDTKHDVSTFLNFSGSLATPASLAVDSHGVNAQRPFLRSPFLSGSRYEPGYPIPIGTFVRVSPILSVSNVASDGLMTSGSWTYEAMYRFPSLLTGSHAVSQSLVRYNTTGTIAGPSGSGGVLTNLLAISGSGLLLCVSPGYSGSTHPTLYLPLTGVDVMDGHQWNVSFGRNRADDVGAFVSASYFVRAARQNFGTLVESHVTSAFFNESGSATGSQNAFEIISPQFNASGTFFTIGSQSLDSVSLFLNDPLVSSSARITDFDGLVGQIRFWSTGLTIDEWHEHVMNFRSIGVADPLTNFGFAPKTSGSFGRLRVDASIEQPITKSNADGSYIVFDFSQNNMHITGSGFEASTTVLEPQRMFYSQLSPRFDEAASNNKVRVRGFLDYQNVNMLGGAVGPIHEIPRSEIPNDDTRFSIDFSIADALNDDIIKIFSTLDEFNSALGNPELIFSPDYPELENMRDIYFNRLTGQVRLRQFFEFFKWFDSVLGISTFIEQLVPRKTRFLGTNFVIESHILERAKLEHMSTDIYLGEDNRHGLKGTILLQQFEALIRRS